MVKLPYSAKFISLNDTQRERARKRSNKAHAKRHIKINR